MVHVSVLFPSSPVTERDAGAHSYLLEKLEVNCRFQELFHRARAMLDKTLLAEGDGLALDGNREFHGLGGKSARKDRGESRRRRL